jgi:hypothetical protein
VGTDGAVTRASRLKCLSTATWPRRGAIGSASAATGEERVRARYSRYQRTRTSVTPETTGAATRAIGGLVRVVLRTQGRARGSKTR